MTVTERLQAIEEGVAWLWRAAKAIDAENIIVESDTIMVTRDNGKYRLWVSFDVDLLKSTVEIYDECSPGPFVETDFERVGDPFLSDAAVHEGLAFLRGLA